MAMLLRQRSLYRSWRIGRPNWERPLSNATVMSQRTAAAKELASENVEVDPLQVKSFEDIPGPGTGFIASMKTIYTIWRDGTWDKPYLMHRMNKEKYGMIYKGLLGKDMVVVIFDPADMEKVIRKEGKWPERIDLIPFSAYKKLKGKVPGMLTNHGEDWKRNRSAVNKIMHPKYVEAFTEVSNEVITAFMSQIVKHQNGDGIVPDIEQLLFRWTMETTASIVLGEKLGFLEDNVPPDSEAFLSAVRNILFDYLWLMAIPISLHKNLNTRPWKRNMEAWDTIYRVGEQFIGKKLSKLSNGESTTNDIATHIASQPQISKEEVYANIQELLTGSDTTATLMLWVLYSLTEHPQIQEEVRDEVMKIVPKGQHPTSEHLGKMNYLKAFVKETTRLYGPTPGFIRTLPEDIVLKGYNVPAGTPISAVTLVMARDPSIFKDPLNFKPERWLRGEERESSAFKMAPFGVGQRMCVGKRVAELESYLLLTRLLQHYKIVKTKNEVTGVGNSLVLPDRPLDLKFIKIN